MTTRDFSSTGNAATAGAIALGVESPDPSIAGQSRREAAMLALGRRAVASPDVAVLMHDAASLIAETLGAEFFGVARTLPDGISLSQCVSSTGR